MENEQNLEEEELIPDVHVNYENIKDRIGFPSCRHVMSFMAFLGFFNVYALRVNLSVALVAMVNQTEVTTYSNTTDDECPDHLSNSTTTRVGPFNWSPDLQGFILGSFFYGYILTQIPGGWLSERYGAKLIYGCGVLCTSVFTLVTPVAANTSPYLLIAIRVIEGIGEGVTFPACHALIAKWAPPKERSKLGAFIYAGAFIGTVFSLPISGYLCQSTFLGGWPSVFYLFGTLGCVWFVGWMLLVHNSPDTHPRITFAEKQYIIKSIGHEEIRPRTPWSAILTSVPFWGILMAHVCNNWGFYTLLTCMPTYMKKVLKFDLSSNGILSAIPYLCQWIISNAAGQGADQLRSRNILSTTAVRKVFNTAGLIGPAVFIILAGYVGCNRTLAVIFLSLGVGTGGFAIAGYGVNHLDLAPAFAGTMLGMTNAAATIPGFVGPQVVGILTDHNPSRHQWQIVFGIAAGIYTLGALAFLLLASGKEQPWSYSSQSKQKRNYDLQNSSDSERLIFRPDIPDGLQHID